MRFSTSRSSPGTARCRRRPGGAAGCRLTALGKALLAFSADAGRAWLKANTLLEARTARTIVDLEGMQRELHDARHAGLAYDREEAQAGF